MIGYDNQYVFSFNLGEIRNFIEEPELTSFIIIEKAGFTLPQFELHFSSSDEDIIPRLNEGQILSVQYGSSRDSLQEAELSIVGFPIVKESMTERTYILTGFINRLPYMNTPRNKITNRISGLQAVRETVESTGFRFISNVEQSEDRQRWIQSRETDYKFVKNTLLRSTAKNNSFFASAITTDSRFKMIDIVKYIRDVDYDWKFTNNVQSNRDILYDESMGIESNTGTVASIVGYGREKIQYNLDSGVTTKILKKPTPTLSLSRDLPYLESIDKRSNSIGVINSNVHPKYHESYLNNITRLVSLSGIKVTLTIPNNRYVPIEPLDKVMFKDKNLDQFGTNVTSEFTSGLYIVGSVSKELMQKRFVTTVTLYRESFNSIRN